MLVKITVITSVFNSSFFLDHFIEDIKRQTIFEECEFFFLDADSQDDSRAKILKEVANYPNIQYFNVGKKNIYATWNIGVMLSKTKYLTNWNTDDRRLPSSLEKQVSFLEKNQELDLCYGETYWTNIPNQFSEYSSCRETSPCIGASFKEMMQVNSPHCLPVWRRRLHENYGLFDDSFFSAGDYEMWIRAISRGSKFGKMNEIVGSYYRNPTGISSNPETLDLAVAEVMKIRKYYGEQA